MARPATYDDATRTALVEATATALAAGGPAAVTLRGVAADVGATTSAIYALFGSKDGLLAAVHREAFAGLAHELGQVEVVDDPLLELFELGLAYRRSALARPSLYLVMFGRDPRLVPTDPDDVAAAAATLGRLRDAVARAQAADSLPGTDPDGVTLELWALVHGLASLELLGALGSATDADARWERALRAIVTGLRAGV
ncbi:MAG: WHG domain-containing protein [Egicoccus sp.]